VASSVFCGRVGRRGADRCCPSPGKKRHGSASSRGCITKRCARQQCGFAGTPNTAELSTTRNGLADCRRQGSNKRIASISRRPRDLVGNSVSDKSCASSFGISASGSRSQSLCCSEGRHQEWLRIGAAGTIGYGNRLVNSHRQGRDALKRKQWRDIIRARSFFDRSEPETVDLPPCPNLTDDRVDPLAAARICWRRCIATAIGVVADGLSWMTGASVSRQGSICLDLARAGRARWWGGGCRNSAAIAEAGERCAM